MAQLVVRNIENEVKARLQRRARRNGRSWGMIAMALGVSKQAARKRYGEPSQLGA